MTYETIDCGGGHEMRDNGVGDYDMYCPKAGRMHFIPYMLAIGAHRGGPYICDGCGEAFKPEPPKDDWASQMPGSFQQIHGTEI